MSEKKEFEKLVKECGYKGRNGAKCVNEDNEKWRLVGSCSAEWCPVINPKPDLPEDEKGEEENVDTPESETEEGGDAEDEKEKEKNGDVRGVEKEEGLDERIERVGGMIKEEEKEDTVGRGKTPVEVKIDLNDTKVKGNQEDLNK